MKNKFIKCIVLTTFCFLPLAAYAAGIDSSNPWDNFLKWFLDSMTGTTATVLGAIALAGSGFAFLRGRIELMTLIAILIGLGIIFGAPHLAQMLQSKVGG